MTVKSGYSEAENSNPAGTADEKPLDKMTKAELIDAARDLQVKADKHYDLYLRSMADMENVKKRNAKEREEWHKYANEGLIKEILPVVDNLEKAILHSQDQNVLHALRDGVELTLKGLKEALTRSGVQEVEALGVPFDPCFHEAVSQMVDEEMEAGVVLRELQKGYILNGRLIRPSMVIVSKGRGMESENQDESPGGASCEEIH
ncbi:MAG: nucleotide exchange factor GrpE [Deltaproteobacteria bacterium]|nr:nucleotide exchange factor GrpE [Deltaproteobacteria bacterium]